MRALPLALLLCLTAAAASAQAPDKKPRELHGKVTEVNVSTKSLTVEHDTVPGWMEAMTMSYPVEKESVLKDIKPGDQITATVYVGDLTLHNVRVMKGKARAVR